MQFQDSEFMTAEEKQLVLKQWLTFLKHGCKWEHFTKRLYHHLIQHCSFIAHYDRSGFYADYFETGDDRAKFLSQFDKRKAAPFSGRNIPRSVEYGTIYWAEDDYADINLAMIEAASGYIPALLKESAIQQRAADIAEAKALLAKHGIALEA